MALGLSGHAADDFTRSGVSGQGGERYLSHRRPAPAPVRGKLFRIRNTARDAALPAAGHLPQAATRNCAPAILRRSLQGPGHQAAPGTRPHQGPCAHGNNRRCACGYAVRVRLPQAGGAIGSDAGPGRRRCRLWRRLGTAQHPHDPASGHTPGPARPQRRRQIDDDEAAGGRAHSAGRPSRRGQGLADRLLRTASARTVASDESALWHLTRLSPKTREQELRDFIGGFNFHGDQATEPIGPMSGGEKSRLALALIVWQRPNLLLLDEPTNHLDLEMPHALTLGLQDYERALVLVSHDRSLLRTTADELWLVDEGRVAPYDGDLEDYAKRLRDKEQGLAVNAAPAVSRKEQKRLEAEERNRRFAQRKPLEARIKSTEKEIATLGAERLRLEKVMAAPDMYGESRKDDLKRCLLEQAQVAKKLQGAEERWLALSAELEALATSA